MIPNKYFYTIGETCQLTGTKPHVLRYWESQFKLLRPARRYSGHRKYTPQDIDLINRIRFLVIDKKFTLAGAKREINRQLNGRAVDSSSTSRTASSSALPMLQELKNDVEACLKILQPAEESQLLELKL